MIQINKVIEGGMAHYNKPIKHLGFFKEFLGKKSLLKETSSFTALNTENFIKIW